MVHLIEWKSDGYRETSGCAIWGGGGGGGVWGVGCGVESSVVRALPLDTVSDPRPASHDAHRLVSENSVLGDMPTVMPVRVHLRARIF